MILAFLELTLRSFKNRIVMRVRRLREPRYVVGAVLAATYFGWIFFRNRGGVGRMTRAFPALDIVVDVVSVGLLLVMLLAWALPQDSGGLQFSDAEIAFLFPAPLRRRDLLLYKVLRQQPQVLTSVIIFSLMGATRSKFIGLWIAFSVMSVYMMLVALGRARLRLLGVNFVVRLVAVLGIIGGIAYSAYLTLRTTLFVHAESPAIVMKQLRLLFERPFLRVILFVPRLFAGALVPPTTVTLLTSALALLALGVVFFFLANRLNVSFEEASIVATQQRNQRVERLRERRGGSYVMFPRARAPFRLAERGRPEVAIVWKNTVATMRMSLAWIVIIAITFAVLVANAFLGGVHAQHGIGFTFLMLTCMLPFIGPNIFANDLRLDLPRLEVLKSYPLSGDSIVAAEIAAPLVIIAVLELVCIAFAALFLEWSGSMNFVDGAQFATVALLLAVPIVALQLLIRNSVPVIFPAWAGRAKEDPRGFAMTGQRLLLVIGNLFVLAIALVPAAIVFAPAAWIALHYFSGTPISLALMTMPAIAVIVGEVWLGVRFLGDRFEELDVSEEFDTIAV